MGKSWRLHQCNFGEFWPLNAHSECLNVENLRSQNGKYYAVIVFYSQFSTAFPIYYTLIFYTISCVFSTISSIFTPIFPIFSGKSSPFSQLFNIFNIVFNIFCGKPLEKVKLLKTLWNMLITSLNYSL